MIDRLRRLGYRHWTLRARLTILYGGLFLIAGFAVLAVTYLLMYRTLGRVDAHLVVVEPTPANGGALDKQAVAEQIAAARRLALENRALTLRWLVKLGLAALGLVGLVAIWLGWLVAGRVLRPLGAITATARRVADRSLHERIRATGPRDEVRQLADTFDEMLERLDHAFDGQRAFVGNASHELKTPLAINRTLVEVAMGRPGAPSELLHLGHTLLEVNARHERLIDGLLMLARSGQRLTARTRVDLAEVCAQLTRQVPDATALVPADGTAGPTPHLELLAAPVLGDPLLLERLAHNLIQNARRYNVPGGEVWVHTSVEGDGAVLRVANTGPVVAGYEAAGLFEPFRRLGADRVGSARGTGLGLSIVRSVARAHGGDASAQARPAAAGGGLEVTVRLPVG